MNIILSMTRPNLKFYCDSKLKLSWVRTCSQE